MTMTDDRELLEAAARAAGIDGVYCEHMNAIRRLPGKDTPYGKAHSYWNALQDDGEALQLAVMLGIDIEYVGRGSEVIASWRIGGKFGGNVVEEMGSLRNGPEPYAAVRRAIVRAAASLSQEKPHG
jgi:hypothetical protein